MMSESHRTGSTKKISPYFQCPIISPVEFKYSEVWLIDMAELSEPLLITIAELI
jgi:hypothetical protein